MQIIRTRWFICKFMGWLTAMVVPVPRGVWRCLRWKRTFLWYHSFGQRHGYVNRRRGKRGRRDIPFVKISRRSGMSTLGMLLSRTWWCILQRSVRPSLSFTLRWH
jgi:hypothetical protein